MMNRSAQFASDAAAAAAFSDTSFNKIDAQNVQGKKASSGP